MAMLVPLLLPHIVAAGANIGLGLSNAFQGDSSSVSLQIGKKVFTTKRSCNLNTLPPELRIRIILMALEESRTLILPPSLGPPDPFGRQDLHELEERNPFNPASETYGSIKGEYAEANGYPLSAWRWSLVSQEWRDVLKEPLWENLEVKGYNKYTRLLRGLESKDGIPWPSRVKTLTLREGFTAPQDLYQILSASLPALSSIHVLPDYPTSYSPMTYAPPVFPFGLQLLKTARPCTSFTFGLPLESTTNPSSRQSLKALNPRKLSLTFARPTVSLFTEIAELVGKSVDVLTIRYIPIRGFVDSQMFLCDALQSFKKIELHLLMPRPRMIFVGEGDSRTLVEDPDSPAKRFITSLIESLETSSDEVQARYIVWTVDEWDVPGRANKAVRDKIWPKEALWDLDAEDAAVEQQPSTTAAPAPASKQKQTHWERETNLKLLGGLFSLRLESKKR